MAHFCFYVKRRRYENSSAKWKRQMALVNDFIIPGSKQPKEEQFSCFMKLSFASMQNSVLVLQVVSHWVHDIKQ